MSLEQHKLQRNVSVYAIKEYVWGGEVKEMLQDYRNNSQTRRKIVCIHRLKAPFASQPLSAT